MVLSIASIILLFACVGQSPVILIDVDDVRKFTDSNNAMMFMMNMTLSFLYYPFALSILNGLLAWNYLRKCRNKLKHVMDNVENSVLEA